MSFFTRRGRRERDAPSPGTSTSTDGLAGGLSRSSNPDSEPGSLFLAYLCPVGEPVTSSTPFVQLRVNAQDMISLVTEACKAPPLTALDELSGCFYDIRLISSSEPSQLVACLLPTQRDLKTEDHHPPRPTSPTPWVNRSHESAPRCSLHKLLVC